MDRSGHRIRFDRGWQPGEDGDLRVNGCKVRFGKRFFPTGWAVRFFICGLGVRFTPAGAEPARVSDFF